MALVINMKSANPEQELFKKLLTSKEDVALSQQVLAIQGIKFTLGFYNVAAQFKGAEGSQTLGVNLPVSVTAILKGTVGTDQLLLCRKELVSLLEEVKSSTFSLDGPFAHPNLQNVPKGGKFKLDLKGTKVFMDDGLTPPDSFLTADPFKSVYTKSVGPSQAIPLRMATQLGQKVLGTSAGSVYKVAAMSSTVRLAMRLHGGQLSVRAEGEFMTDGDRNTMANFGMTQNKSPEGFEYWSMHLTLGSVPVARVVGAVVMGLGLDFSTVIAQPKEVL